MIEPAADSDVDFVLQVTARATESANGDTNSRTDTIHVDVVAVADMPALTVPSSITVEEDTQSATLTISSSLTDTDGSESLLLEISALPVGTQLSDGSNSFTATSGNTVVDVTTWDRSNLQITPPTDSDQDFAVIVTSTATEAENADQAVRSDTVNVLVTAVADQPALTVPATVTVNEDTQSAVFTVSSSLGDTDGSETLVLEVANLPVGATLTDGTNSFTSTSGSNTVEITGWSLANLAVTPPTNSDVDFTLTVTATATEAANSDQSARVDFITVEVEAVADQPNLTVPATITINEDTQSAVFTISSSLNDIDGSEDLFVEVSDIPVGATLSDGTRNFTAMTGSSSVDVTGWSLASLTITPATNSDQNFALTVTATSTEADNGHQSVNVDSIAVQVAAVGDLPTLTVPSTIAVNEDTQSANFTISSALSDTDGSETLTLVISDVPEGTRLTDGLNAFAASTGNTTVNVSAWNLSSLTITPAADSDVDFTLTVIATATEAANSDAAVNFDTINVQVTAVADQPTLTVPSTIAVNEDTNSANFAINSALTDTDGSESLSLEIENLPVGTTLTDGTNTFVASIGGTTVNITSWNLTNLSVTPAGNSDQDFTLSVTATATEGANGDVSVNADTILVTINPVADQPSLTVPATITVNEDTQSANFTITSALADTDGSESLLLEVSEIPVGTQISDGTNLFTAATGSTTVDVTSWNLTNLSVTPAANSDQDFTLTVTATATETANHDQSANIDTISVAVNAVADLPTLIVPSTISVDEDTQSAAFTINSALTDTDGSESLVVVVSDVQVGATLSDGTNSFTATTGTTSVDVSGWSLASLKITPAVDSNADFTLTITSTATEAANSDQSVNSDSISVIVNAVADQPSLTVPSTIAINEDTQSAAFSIATSLNDTDGSESLQLTVSDVPVGATLTDGSFVFTGSSGNSSVTVTGWNLTNLKVNPPADSDVDFTLTVTATSTEAANGDQATIVDTIEVQVTAVADQPSLTVPSTITVYEDTQTAAFTVNSALVDSDGSESLQLTITDLPVGAVLTDGVNGFTASTGNTTIDVTSWNLSNLSITPPANSDVDFALTVTATATEAANSDQAANVETISVQVTAVADVPTITVPSTIVINEDTQSAAFAVSSSLTDSDGSETLLLTVDDVPEGATLTDGTNSFTATSGSTSVDVTSWNLTNLQVTPPTNSDVDFTLIVTSTATEAENGDQAVNSDSINVQVTAVADQTSLTVPSTITVNEDTNSANFTVSSSLHDADGSESLLVEISAIPAGARLTDGTNVFVASPGNSVVDVSSWSLANLSVTPPADSDVDFVLTVTATTTEAANSDQRVKSDSIAVEVVAVADQPTLTVPSTITVNEDTATASFAVGTALVDTDGSESLLVTISDLPVGVALSDGTNMFVASSGNTTVDVTSWSLSSLSVTPPADADDDFALTVTSISTEAENLDQAVKSDSISVEVTAIADVPTLTVPSTIVVNEDTQSAVFTISSALSDTDGSETLRVEISAVPVGATLTDGTNVFTATTGGTAIDVTNWTLNNLSIQAPTNSDVDFTLVVTSTATEANGGDAAVNSDAIDVQVTAVADQPTLTVPSTITVDEDTESAVFSITSALTDTDGSETLQLDVSGIPVGATLTDGINVFTAATGNTMVDITSWDLGNLSVTPPVDSGNNFILTVTATATEAENSDQSSNTDSINIQVNAVADVPSLTVPSSVTVDEDTQTPRSQWRLC